MYKISLPSRDEIMVAISRMETKALLAKNFGKYWFRRGDPRPLLGVAYSDLYDWYQMHGIPRSVLVEGKWYGHDHYVIADDDGKWRFGFAERGYVDLISEHSSLEEAREAVLKELWSLYELDGNPYHWSGGVAAGTPFPKTAWYKKFRFFR